MFAERAWFARAVFGRCVRVLRSPPSQVFSTADREAAQAGIPKIRSLLQLVRIIVRLYVRNQSGSISGLGRCQTPTVTSSVLGSVRGELLEVATMIGVRSGCRNPFNQGLICSINRQTEASQLNLLSDQSV